eukprot:scaffold32375_cov41-Cyclotella_meneghiniana.AAC.1
MAQKYPIGTTVSKLFDDEDASGGKRFFAGSITDFDKMKKYYKVCFEDGDEEELTEGEVDVLETKLPIKKGRAIKTAKAKVAKKTTKLKPAKKVKQVVVKTTNVDKSVDESDDESADESFIESIGEYVIESEDDCHYDDMKEHNRRLFGSYHYGPEMSEHMRRLHGGSYSPGSDY